MSLEALLAISAHWSLQGFALPYTALKIYRDIDRGARQFDQRALRPDAAVGRRQDRHDRRAVRGCASRRAVICWFGVAGRLALAYWV